MKQKIKILLIVFALAFCTFFLCIPVSAATHGTCGSNLTWSLSSDGTLTISGSGYMGSYGMGSAPWANSSIKKVVIEEGCTSIGQYAFYHAKYIESVSLPSTLQIIDVGAFQGCNALTNIEIPASVNTINSSAFSGSGLKAVTIPSAVKTLDFNVFQNCTDLETVTLPEGLTEIKSSAFFGCSKLKEITIPRTVTTIYGQIFYNCTSLEKVTLSEGLTQIGMKAFFGCSKLTEITIPSTVATIDKEAFSGCTGLKKVTNLSSATIGADAFPTPTGSCGESATWKFDFISGKLEITGTGAMTDYSSASLVPWADYKDSIKTVTISEGITSVGNYAFADYTALKEVTLPETLTAIGYRAFYRSGLTGSIIIPDNVGAIKESAFYGCGSLETVTFGKNLKTLSPYSFQNCTALKRMTFTGTSLEFIYRAAFSGCSALTEIEGTAPSVKAITDLAFFGCKALKRFPTKVFPGLTSIGSEAFRDCTALTEVILPDSLTALDKYAFRGCTGLTRVNFGSGLTSIGLWAFFGCASLTEVTLPETLTYMDNGAFRNCTSLTEVTLPDSLTILNGGVFYGCTALTSVHLGAGLTDIQNEAFYNCKRLNNVTFGNSLTSIFPRAFYGCKALENVTFPESLSGIGVSAFYDTAITHVHIPKNVKSIGLAAFSHNKLESITVDSENTYFRVSDNCLINIASKTLIAAAANPKIPADGSVTIIGDHAFYGLSITEITIPSGVVSLGLNAFDSCTALTHITLPETLTTIGLYAFRNCPSLKTVIILAKDAKFSVVDNTAGKRATFPFTTTVYAYESAEMKDYVKNFQPIYSGSLDGGEIGGKDSIQWRLIANDLEIIGYGEIPDFSESAGAPWKPYSSSIQTVTISGDISEIGAYSFYHCTALVRVTICTEASLWVGTFAFAGCTNLQTVTVQEKEILHTIGDSAFADCSSLRDFDFGEGLSRVESEAFKNCSSLTSVSFPNTVSFLGKRIFVGCTNLTSLSIEEGSSWFHSENNLIMKWNDVGGVRNGRIVVLACPGLKEVILPDDVTAIWEYAFADCTLLEKITLPQGLGTIKEGAFMDCTGLKKIILPESLVSLGTRAFYGAGLVSVTLPVYTEYGYEIFKNCTSLKTVNFSQGSAIIGVQMFENCTSLEEITFPKNTLVIDEYAFYGCTALKKVTILAMYTMMIEGSPTVFPETTIICGIVGSEAEKYAKEYGRTFEPIPSGKCGDNLTWIFWPDCTLEISGTGAMFDYEKGAAPWSDYLSSIQKIIISEGVKTIGAYAFDSVELTEIKLPESLTAIGEGAFYGSRLKAMKLPDGITTIGKRAFADCVYLTKIELPKSVTFIGSAPFVGCFALKNVIIPAENTAYGIVDNIFLFEKETGKILAAYNVSGTVNIPGGVKIIGESAFQGCTMLLRLEITQTLVEIEKDAFKGCSSLESVNGKSGLKHIGDGTFSGCILLKTITLSRGLLSIGSEAFLNCALRSVTIPGTVTSIGVSAFAGCASLEDLTIRYGVSTISERMFAGCTSLRSVFIPASVAEICAGAFAGCPLSDVTIVSCNITIADSADTLPSDSISTLEESSGARDYATKYDIQLAFLMGGSCGDNLVWYIIGEVLYIDGRGEMRGYDINDGTKAPWIEHSEYFSYVNIGSMVTSISEMAFYGCHIERFIVDQDNGMVKVVYNCLINVKKKMLIAVCKDGAIIPDNGSVTAIGAYAFYGYCGTNAITIPLAITRIGQGAFCNCQAPLGEIYLGDHVELVGFEAFMNSTVTKVYIGKVKTIGDKAFFGCQSLEKVEIHTSISESMFQNCVKLSSVTFGDGVIEIGKLAFYGCTAWSGVVYLPEGLQKIGGNIFTSTGIRSVVVPASVTFIDVCAFVGSLEDVVILSKDVVFASSVFGYGCFVTVYGYAGSTTETYANASKNYEENITFIAINDNTPVRIEVKTLPDRTAYMVGANFDPTGMIVVVVSADGRRTVITDYTVTGGDSLASGITKVTISYTVDGKTFTTTVSVLAITLAHNCSFGNDLSMLYAIRMSDLGECASLFFTVGKDVYNGNLFDRTVWETLEPMMVEINGIQYLRFDYRGVAAKEMGDTLTAILTVTIDGVEYHGVVDVYSLKQYAMERLENSDNETFKTLLVDLLNYSAAAQTYFGYRTDALVNADLTDEQRILATPNYEDLNVSVNEDTNDDLYAIKAKNVLFDNRIKLLFATNITDKDVLSDIALVVSYLNWNGEVVDSVIYGTNFIYRDDLKCYAACVDWLKASELRTELSLTLVSLEGEGGESTTVKYGFDTYASNRLAGSTNENFKDLLKMTLIYSDSAKEYFSNEAKSN